MPKYARSFTLLRCAGLVLVSLLLLAPNLRSSEAPTRAAAQSAGLAGGRVYLPVIHTGSSTAGPVESWVTHLNSYRRMAGLPDLINNPTWSQGNRNHAIYAVKNDYLAHDEDPVKPWYTPEGRSAAQTSNLMASGNFATSDEYAIDSWMQAPFHAVGILDPALQQVSFGSYREEDGGLQMSAGLDILRGLGQIPAHLSYPLAWPGQGAVVPLTQFKSEHPDPLTSCPGYRAPAGLPVILQIGSGNFSPTVSKTSFKQGKTALEHCVFTESTYVNPDPAAQQMGRAVLNDRDAIVLVPRLPLKAGATYSVSITVDGKTYTWSFSVAKTAGVAVLPPQ